MTRLNSPSDLWLIRDKAKEFHERIATKGYTECKGDALSVSQLADDLRDVLLEYQVSGNPGELAQLRLLNLRCLDRRYNNRKCTIRLVG